MIRALHASLSPRSGTEVGDKSPWGTIINGSTPPSCVLTQDGPGLQSRGAQQALPAAFPPASLPSPHSVGLEPTHFNPSCRPRHGDIRLFLVGWARGWRWGGTGPVHRRDVHSSLTGSLPPLPGAPGWASTILAAGATSFKKPTSPGPAQAGLQVALGGCYFRARSTDSSFMATARSPFTCSRPLM